MKRNWAERFIGLAQEISHWSKDTSTKVGAILVSKDNEIIATGFNDFPRGVCDSIQHNYERRERPDKYLWTEHAERNAIYSAAKRGTITEGSILVLNWSPYPCADCARALIQAGVKEVVGPNRPFPNLNTWGKPIEISKQMMKEAGIAITTINYDKL